MLWCARTFPACWTYLLPNLQWRCFFSIFNSSSMTITCLKAATLTALHLFSVIWASTAYTLAPHYLNQSHSILVHVQNSQPTLTPRLCHNAFIIITCSSFWLSTYTDYKNTQTFSKKIRCLITQNCLENECFMIASVHCSCKKEHFCIVTKCFQITMTD